MEAGKFYTGTKTLKAWPMSRGEYNAYRGWSAPEGEDQSTLGYLVEYTDGGKPNDERHAGYISWSPAEVFDAAYRPSGSFQDRVRLEKEQLDEKRMGLAAFFGMATFAGLPAAEQQRMRDQLDAMRDYSTILGERIEAFVQVTD